MDSNIIENTVAQSGSRFKPMSLPTIEKTSGLYSHIVYGIVDRSYDQAYLLEDRDLDLEDRVIYRIDDEKFKPNIEKILYYTYQLKQDKVYITVYDSIDREYTLFDGYIAKLQLCGDRVIRYRWQFNNANTIEDLGIPLNKQKNTLNLFLDDLLGILKTSKPLISAKDKADAIRIEKIRKLEIENTKKVFMSNRQQNKLERAKNTRNRKRSRKK